MFTILLVSLARTCQGLTDLRHLTLTQPEGYWLLYSSLHRPEQESPRDYLVQSVYFTER